MLLGKKIKLEPNNQQRSAFAGHAGAKRFAYNYFLDVCKVSYSFTKKVPSAIDMHKMLVEMKNNNR